MANPTIHLYISKKKLLELSIVTNQGHISQVSTTNITEGVSDKTRQWSDLGLIKMEGLTKNILATELCLRNRQIKKTFNINSNLKSDTLRSLVVSRRCKKGMWPSLQMICSYRCRHLSIMNVTFHTTFREEKLNFLSVQKILNWCLLMS